MAGKYKSKKIEKRIRLPGSCIPGRRYMDDMPYSCRYCYWWLDKAKDCARISCWYLLPEEPKREGCAACPYGRIHPCIGYCIDELQRDVFLGSREWKGSSE